MKSRLQQKGVTLLELIVVMIIVGILAAVAIPSYRQYVIRSQRSDAKDALLSLATAQEKFYLQCNTYAAGFAVAPNCAALNLQGTNSSKNGWYTLAIPARTATSYTITATATAGGNQFQDTDCRRFQMNERGIRTAINAANADNSAACWR
jgi:type IV pilus assembly protein PilE